MSGIAPTRFVTQARLLEIHIEYCSSCGFRDMADGVEDALEQSFGAQVGVTLESGRGGSLEVTTNNKATVIHSRLVSKTDPDIGAIIKKVRSLLADPTVQAQAVARQADTASKARRDAQNLTDGEADAIVKNLSRAQPVVVFAHASKPMWASTKAVLATGSINYTLVDLEGRLDGERLAEALVRATRSSSLPAVFSNGVYVGSHEEVARRVAAGGLDASAGASSGNHGGSGAGASVIVDVQASKIGHDGLKYVLANTVPRKQVPSTPFRLPLFMRWPLFWFPYNVNAVAAQITGLLVCAGSVICAIFADRWWGRLLIAAMFTDVTLRVVFGGRGSFLGTLADAMAEAFQVHITPGPPKQFAQMISWMMLAGATLSVFKPHWPGMSDSATGTDTSDANVIAGRVFLAGLAGACGLEGFLDFCLGCWFYKIFQKLGLFSKDPSAKCDESAAEVKAGLNYFRKHDSAAPRGALVRFVERMLGFQYMPKSEAQRKDDFNIIRHCSVTYFAMPMGLSSLAFAFKITHLSHTAFNTLQFDRGLWVGVAILAAVVFCIVLGLYLAKVVLYWRKVQTEFECPIRGHSFAAITLTMQMFAGLLADSESTINTQFAEVLFWASGPANAILAAVIVARWIFRPHHRSTMNPGWMMAPVGCLICGAVFPMINARYTEPAFFFFSFGILFWIILLPMVLQGATFSMLNNRLRHGVFILLAAPAAALVSYLSVTGSLFGEFDTFAKFLFYFTLVMLLLMLVLLLNSFFFRTKWSMDYWMSSFPTSALCMACALYNAQLPNSVWAEWLLYQSLALACVTNLVLCAHTLAGLVGRQGVFVYESLPSPNQWGVISHFAMRGALANMVTLSKNLADPTTCRKFVEMFNMYKTTFLGHAVYEDTVLFPAGEEMFPGVSDMVSCDHHRESQTMEALGGLVAQLAPSLNIEVLSPSSIKVQYKDVSPVPLQAHEAVVASPNLTAQVQQLTLHMSQAHNEHMDLEEQHFVPSLRKNTGAQRAKAIGRAMFACIPADTWRKILPFIVTNFEMHHNRVAFVSSFVANMPERAQLFGHWIYEGVTPALWDRISVDVPDIIPKGLPGHSHQY